MNELIMTLTLDICVALLLGITIYCCVKLNRRVKLLQDSKSELATLIRQFDESTQQATVSIHEIHRASKRINQNIQEKLDKANYLADDLAFMIERANKTADKIEQHIADGRGTTKRSASDAVPQANKASKEAAAPRRARRSLDEVVAENTSTSKDKKGIEAMMDRITELRANQKEAPAKKQRPLARMRSKTEQDLMQTLKQQEGEKV